MRAIVTEVEFVLRADLTRPICIFFPDTDLVMSSCGIFGRKAFRFSAPTVWNSIPQNIRLSSSMGSFKRYLKTYLFSLPG